MSREAGRWKGHPVAARLLQVAIFLVPVLAATAAGATVGRLVPHEDGLASTIGWWALVIAVSTAALVIGNALVRRFLPLALMLQLALAFPGRAPSRFAVALRAGSPNRIEAWARRTAAEPVPDATPARHAETVLTLVMALQTHDRRTRGHSDRVRALTEVVGAELRLEPDEMDRLRWAALLHDIGKLRVPASILNKKGALTAPEREEMRLHPEEGGRIAFPLAEWMGDWYHAIDQHHERYDGEGYPFALAGEQISYGGRIVAATDAFETMTAVRSYKRAMSAADGRAELAACSGAQFDPRVVRAFLNVSLLRLTWAMGPLSWFAQVPLVGVLSRADLAIAGAFSAGASAAPVIAASAFIALGSGASVDRGDSDAASAGGSSPPPASVPAADAVPGADLPGFRTPAVDSLTDVVQETAANLPLPTIPGVPAGPIVDATLDQVDDILFSLPNPLDQL